MLDGLRINRIRGSPGSAKPEQQGTVDPSSTTISSKSWNVCRQTLEIARRSNSGRLYVGNTIEKTGALPDGRSHMAEWLRSDGELNKCDVMTAVDTSTL
jgi:hypothetical protein